MAVEDRPKSEAGENTSQMSRRAKEEGFDIKSYYLNNGVFAAKEFKVDCEQLKQTINFSCVEAQHQNGVAENTTKQLTLASRTMLLHAQRYWPEYISTMLWPFALLAALRPHLDELLRGRRVRRGGRVPHRRIRAPAPRPDGPARAAPRRARV